jgi:hypothetical protein
VEKGRQGPGFSTVEPHSYYGRIRQRDIFGGKVVPRLINSAPGQESKRSHLTLPQNSQAV